MCSLAFLASRRKQWYWGNCVLLPSARGAGHFHPYQRNDSGRALPMMMAILIMNSSRAVSNTLSDCLSRALHKYPGEVLAMCTEDNQPQDYYDDRRCYTTSIQEHVITNDVHDYRPKQHQRERYESVR